MSDEQDHDKFNDIKNAHIGVFGASLDAHDRINATAKRNGLALEFKCNGCGTTTQILVEWPELVAMKYGLDPKQAFANKPGIIGGTLMSWVFEPVEQRWRPEATCGNCEFHFLVRLTADEPERHLAAGRRAGFINIAAENLVSMHCDKLRQALAGAPRR